MKNKKYATVKECPCALFSYESKGIAFQGFKPKEIRCCDMTQLPEHKLCRKSLVVCTALLTSELLSSAAHRNQLTTVDLALLNTDSREQIPEFRHRHNILGEEAEQQVPQPDYLPTQL
jgi:hypothetical protein